MPNDKDVVSHIKEKFGYAKEFGAKRIDLSIDELGHLLQQNEQQQEEIERINKITETLREAVLIWREEESKRKTELQQSREENERISADREFWMNLYQQERDLCKGQKESLIEINGRISADAERLLEENERLRGELERVKELYEHAERDVSRRAAERDEARQFAKKSGDYAEQRNKWMAREQLAEGERDDYRKGLEWYAKGNEDDGLKAESILSRYPEKGE